MRSPSRLLGCGPSRRAPSAARARLDDRQVASRGERATREQHCMSTRRVVGAVSAALSMAVVSALALGACGASSSASSGQLTAASDPAADIAAAATNPVTVSPLPGTADASPRTQISFLGGPGTQISDVRIVGSRSGAHSGRLQAYSTGTGESFLPSRPFLAGERVSVHALVSSSAGAPDQPPATRERTRGTLRTWENRPSGPPPPACRRRCDASSPWVRWRRGRSGHGSARPPPGSVRSTRTGCSARSRTG